MGCHITKGVTEQCMVRLRLTIGYESALDDTLIGIENLNSGYLTHHTLDPKILESIWKQLKMI